MAQPPTCDRCRFPAESVQERAFLVNDTPCVGTPGPHTHEITAWLCDDCQIASLEDLAMSPAEHRELQRLEDES